MVLSIQKTVLKIRTSRIPYREGFFAVLVTLSLTAMCLYAYFLARSVVNVVLRQELAQEVREVESRISMLEGDYLAKNQDITEARAEELGFVAVKSVTYVTVPAESTLTLKR